MATMRLGVGLLFVVLALPACSEVAGLGAYGPSGSEGGSGDTGGAGGTEDGGGGMGGMGLGGSGCLVGTEILRDDFERPDQDGWGTPDNQTNAWQVSDEQRVRIEDGMGLFDVPDQVAPGATWSESVADVEVVATIAYELPQANSQLVQGSLLVRRAGGDFWEARIEVREGEPPMLRVMPAGDPDLFDTVSLPSLADAYRLRFRVTGSDPIALQARIWELGQPEPTEWTIDEQALSGTGVAAGSLAAAGYLQGTMNPFMVRVDDLVACRIER
jgi:hypothetical protein